MQIFNSFLEPANRGNQDYLGSEESNADYIIIPHKGRINDVDHSHSEWSDGMDLVRDMLKEAALLEVDYFGITDHLDLTGISEEEHQGPWLGNFSDNLEYRKESINDIIDDLNWENSQYNTYDLNVARGAEIDFDPNNVGKLRERAIDLEMDYLIGSVHHDRYGVPVKSPQILRNKSLDEKVDEYVEDLQNLAKVGDTIPKFTTVAHPGRAEQGPLGDGITVGTYYPVIDEVNDTDLAWEINPKVHLRYYLNNGELPAEFWALANYDGDLPDITVGTDTHRVGHSESFDEEYKQLREKMFPEIEDSRITESQMRLNFSEQLLDLLEEKRGEEIKYTTVLEDLDLPTVSIADFEARQII